jgi:hypothetical protein
LGVGQALPTPTSMLHSAHRGKGASSLVVRAPE